MAIVRRIAAIAFILLLVGLAGARIPASVSRADTAVTPTATPGPVPEDVCPHITGLTIAAFSAGAVRPTGAVHLHQLLHVAVEWRLNGPAGSTLQPSSLVIRHGGRAIYHGWLNVLYPHAVADVVLQGPHSTGKATLAATVGAAPCASSSAQTVRILPGSPPRQPWIFPDCVSTFTATGAACWLIAGGFKPHEPISVSYLLQPGSGARIVRGGLRGQADGHGIFGSIALDLGNEVSWKTAVLRVDVKAGRSRPVRTTVRLSR